MLSVRAPRCSTQELPGAVCPKEEPRLTYRSVLGMNDKRHSEDQPPKVPFPILDHLSWPTEIPPLMELLSEVRS